MKRTATLFVLLTLVSTLAFAQKEVIEKRQFQPGIFTGVDLSGIVHVVIEKSDVHTLSVETYANVFDYLKVTNRNGVLCIGLQDGGLPKSIQRKYKDLEVLCKVTLPELKWIQTSGVVHLSVRDAFRTDKMEIELSGVTKVDMKYLECNELEIEVSGVSEISLYGQTDQLSAELSGASKGYFSLEGKTLTFAAVKLSGTGKLTLEGKAVRADLDASGTAAFEGGGFEVESMRAAVSGVSKARVRVLGSLEPTLSGASKLHYNRQARLRNVNTSGASRLTYY